jgi:hypothetical protein
MKRQHEHRFSDALEQMRASVSDETWANVIERPATKTSIASGSPA